MIAKRSAMVVLTLIGLLGAGIGGAEPARADEQITTGTELKADGTPAKPAAPAKAKAHKRAPKQDASTSTPTEQYHAPLELNFDPMKRVILKAEPSVPYQPEITSKLPPTTKTGDDLGQARLAPLLREASTPDSFGDKGSFMDRHEFGIQLRDHF
jgi:hypothetical protein